MKGFTPANTSNQLEIYQQVNFLYSLGRDIYKDKAPVKSIMINSPSVEKTKINKIEPDNTSDFCNGNGMSFVLDFYLTCLCNSEFIGNRCQIDKSSYDNLISEYCKKSTINITYITYIKYLTYLT